MKKYVKQAPVLLLIPILLIFLMNWSVFGGDEHSFNQQDAQEIDKLEDVLGTINGVGNVKVYYHEDPTSQKSNLSNYFVEKDHLNGGPIQGILVVAEGGEDPYIRATLLKAISTIFQLAEHQVMIVEMEKGRAFIENE